MKWSLELESQPGRRWRADLAAGRCLALALDFDGPQANAFGLPPATAAPFAAGGFIGDVRQGGSANCFTATLTPHGNGTHTECIGHITAERYFVHQCLQDSLMPALLLSVPLTPRADSAEAYPVAGEGHEQWITAASLQQAAQGLGEVPDESWRALILRSLPNRTDFAQRQYSGAHPPYMSLDAMAWIRRKGVQHLLVDLPSVDREADEGRLQNHHIFWSCESQKPPKEPEALGRTITEMIFVEDDLADGLVLLQLQIPPFLLDAAPSRPIIYPLHSESKR